jgi:hypothetical protein
LLATGSKARSKRLRPRPLVKVEKAKADAEVQKRIATGDIDWEANMADATKDSWKDEFALVVLTAPVYISFHSVSD